jgi:hypothetical protein
MGKYETGTGMKAIGVISGRRHHNRAAITKLMFIKPK